MNEIILPRFLEDPIQSNLALELSQICISDNVKRKTATKLLAGAMFAMKQMGANRLITVVDNRVQALFQRIDVAPKILNNWNYAGKSLALVEIENQDALYEMMLQRSRTDNSTLKKMYYRTSQVCLT